MTSDANSEAWWRDWTIEPNTGAVWEIGPFVLEAFRASNEWIVGRSRREWLDSADGPPPEDPWTMRTTGKRPSEGDLERFVSGGGDDLLALRPRVADRSVVARPRVPLHVLPGEETRVYVSFPIWIEVAAGAKRRPLCDFPAQRLTDTWFGSPTGAGEAAYSLRTRARSALAEVPLRSHRAITPVVLRNDSDTQLVLDRMNLPIPYLALFGTASADLWTERITLVRRGNDEMAGLEVDSGPPREAKGAVLISAPRTERSSGLLVRAFSSLLRTFHDEGLED